MCSHRAGKVKGSFVIAWSRDRGPVRRPMILEMCRRIYKISNGKDM